MLKDVVTLVLQRDDTIMQSRPTAKEVKRMIERGEINMDPSRASMSSSELTSLMNNIQRAFLYPPGADGRWSNYATAHLSELLSKPKLVRTGLLGARPAPALVAPPPQLALGAPPLPPLAPPGAAAVLPLPPSSPHSCNR